MLLLPYHAAAFYTIIPMAGWNEIRVSSVHYVRYTSGCCIFRKIEKIYFLVSMILLSGTFIIYSHRSIKNPSHVMVFVGTHIYFSSLVINPALFRSSQMIAAWLNNWLIATLVQIQLSRCRKICIQMLRHFLTNCLFIFVKMLHADESQTGSTLNLHKFTNPLVFHWKSRKFWWGGKIPRWW